MAAADAARRSEPVPERMSDSGLWVFESRHDEAFFMRSTRHRFVKLLYFREGRGEVVGHWSENRQTVTCGSGDCVVIPAGMSHHIIDHPRHPISLYGLGIASPQLNRCGALHPLLPAGKLSSQRSSVVDIERHMRRLLYLAGQDGVAAQLAALAGAMGLFAQLAMTTPQAGHPTGAGAEATSQTGPVDAIDEYLRWLESNFFEPLSVDHAASLCGMSRRKFTSDFRKRTGKTWLEYLNGRRVAHAQTLLSETERKVTSIAFQSGFEELSTFYRTFKRLTGFQPLQYRQEQSPRHSS